MWISLNYQDRDFGSEAGEYNSSSSGFAGAIRLPLDKKITLFFDRIDGWHLGVAEKIAATVPEAGFASLQIVLSYFESISKYYDGFVKEDESKVHFKKGFVLVFPDMIDSPTGIRDAILNGLYRGARCGLYHLNPA